MPITPPTLHLHTLFFGTRKDTVYIFLRTKNKVKFSDFREVVPVPLRSSNSFGHTTLVRFDLQLCQTLPCNPMNKKHKSTHQTKLAVKQSSKKLQFVIVDFQKILKKSRRNALKNFKILLIFFSEKCLISRKISIVRFRKLWRFFRKKRLVSNNFDAYLKNSLF